MPRARRRRTQRVGVTVTETTFLPGIMKAMEDLRKFEVHVGAAADQSGSQEIAMIAGVHEFGSVKMGIPARSFIRTGKNKAKAASGKVARAGVNDLVQKNETVQGLFTKLGEIALQRTLKNFDSIREPHLSARYAKTRRNGKILVQQQKLRDSLSYKITRR